MAFAVRLNWIPVAISLGFQDRTSRRIAGALRRRSALLLAGSGALCCGRSEEDVLAASVIMEKNTLAVIVSNLFGKGRPLNPIEARLMRFLYLKRYSRKAAR